MLNLFKKKSKKDIKKSTKPNIAKLLFERLSIYIMMITGLIVFASIIYYLMALNILDNQDKALNSQLLTFGKSIVLDVASQCKSSFEMEDSQIVYMEYRKAVMKKPYVIECIIIDQFGMVLAHSDEKYISKETDDPYVKPANREKVLNAPGRIYIKEMEIGKDKKYGKRVAYRFTKPILNNDHNEIYGVVHVYLALTTLQETMRISRKKAMIQYIGTILVAIILGILISMYIINSVKKLNTGIVKIINQDYLAHIDFSPQRADYFKKVYENFNAMVKMLAREREVISKSMSKSIGDFSFVVKRMSNKLADAVFVTDKDGSIVLANQHAEKLLGVTKFGLRDKHITDIFKNHKDFLENLKKAYDKPNHSVKFIVQNLFEDNKELSVIIQAVMHEERLLGTVVSILLDKTGFKYEEKEIDAESSFEEIGESEDTKEVKKEEVKDNISIADKLKNL